MLPGGEEGSSVEIRRGIRDGQKNSRLIGPEIELLDVRWTGPILPVENDLVVSSAQARGTGSGSFRQSQPLPCVGFRGSAPHVEDSQAPGMFAKDDPTAIGRWTRRPDNPLPEQGWTAGGRNVPDAQCPVDLRVHDHRAVGHEPGRACQVQPSDDQGLPPGSQVKHHNLITVDDSWRGRTHSRDDHENRDEYEDHEDRSDHERLAPVHKKDLQRDTATQVSGLKSVTYTVPHGSILHIASSE